MERWNKTVKDYFRIVSNVDRPNALDYIKMIFPVFIEMHGDRLFGDDAAMVTGIGKMKDGTSVTIIGQIRGKTVKESVKYHNSMNYPEGYRKALRAMKQAEKFKRPIVCFVDTVGAFPGDFAEERGQSNAIAVNLMEMMYLKIPIVSVLIGFGGSGGALAICVADEIIMLENSTFGVISPRACANILWKDPNREYDAARLLKMTSVDIDRLGLADTIIEEPQQGAQADPATVAKAVENAIYSGIERCKTMRDDELLCKRYKKFRQF